VFADGGTASISIIKTGPRAAPFFAASLLARRSAFF